MFIEKIKLKKLEKSDLSFRVSLLNHELIKPFLNTKEEFTLDKTEQWFNNIKAKSRSDFVFIYNNSPIGMGGLVNISPIDKNAELYIYLSPDYQGMGLGSLSLKKMCDYGFEVLSLHKIYLYTFSKNRRANLLYERNGFVKEGYLKEHTYKDGELCDRNIYSLIKNEII